MKKLIIILFILNINLLFSQDYLQGKRLYCRSNNAEALRLFNTGIETLYLNTSMNKKYLEMTSGVFFKAYKIDTTFCDALFFTGYTLRLLEDKKAIAFYILADSISGNKSIEFKTNLAAEGLRRGTEKSIKIARRKYEEIIKYFPESPEGYYGHALTSPMFEDVDKGLENINIAIEKYKAKNPQPKEDAIYLKGVLLTLNKRYDEGLELLESSYTNYKKDENFKIYYSLCLLEVSKVKNDEKMKKKASKMYEKIEQKDQIPLEVKELLKF